MLTVQKNDNFHFMAFYLLGALNYFKSIDRACLMMVGQLLQSNFHKLFSFKAKKVFVKIELNWRIQNHLKSTND